MKILQEPDGRLHMVADAVDVFDYREMREANATAVKMIKLAATEHGVGLAGPQVGWMKRMFVAKLSGSFWMTFINPSYSPRGHESVTYEEGCLSVGHGQEYIPVTRPVTIDVTYTTPKGRNIRQTLTNDAARIFMHECDHLDGRTITEWKTEGESQSTDTKDSPPESPQT